MMHFQAQRAGISAGPARIPAPIIANHRMLINIVVSIDLSAFSQKGFQDDHETNGFIRVRILYVAVCEIASCPKEYERFPTSLMCITEYL